MGTYRSAQALVVIRHTSGLNNLYFSDETGAYYSLSLYNIVLDPQNGLDLELVSDTSFLMGKIFTNGTKLAISQKFVSSGILAM